ncbi:MAG: site-2 protease family protein [Planctomycetota bacterium]
MPDFGALDWSTILLLYGTLLVSLVVHEAAHAWLALLGGDTTAYVGGQVTLNPVPHIQREPFGTVILPLGVLVLSNGTMCFGFAHAPYDPHWAWAHPKRAALMSAGGPLANILLAILAFAVLKTMVLTGAAVTVDRYSPLVMLDPASGVDSGPLMAGIKMASAFLLLNVLLALINLIPLPPFDGAGIVEGLARKTAGFYNFVRGQFVVMILVMLLIMRVLPDIFFPVMRWITDWL